MSALNRLSPRNLGAGSFPFLVLLAATAACGTSQEAADATLQESTASELTTADLSGVGRAAITWTAFDDDIGDAGQRETRKIFTADAAYRGYFGHSAPAEVDFAKEWVFFYSAGQRSSGGYTSEVRSIARHRTSLEVVTALESPGPSCVTSLAMTTPHMLARFPRQGGVLGARYYHADHVKDCSMTNPCAATLCAAGERCVLEPLVCVSEPCEPAPRCVPYTPVRCGGLAGATCPGAGHCVDDPSDSCDPARAGRDCSGLCECMATALCRTGRWDSSPSVCACVP